MMQGDAYRVPLNLQLNRTATDDTTFREIELVVGSLKKTMTSGGIVWNKNDKCFYVSFTQEETLKMKPECNVDAQVRVALPDGTVIGSRIPGIHIKESLSKDVI